MIPTAVSPRETQHLRRLARGASALDIGSLLGYSTVQLALVAARVTSIDRHDDYSGPTWSPFQSNVERYARGNVVALRGDAALAAAVPAEIALIDLTGEMGLTEDVLRCLHKAVRVATVHDCTRARCHGVAAALERVRDLWVPVAQIDTLVELRRRPCR